MVTPRGRDRPRLGTSQGAVDYLVKPVSAQALSRRHRRAGRMTSTTSGPETSLRGLRDRPFELLKELGSAAAR